MSDLSDCSFSSNDASEELSIEEISEDEKLIYEAVAENDVEQLILSLEEFDLNEKNSESRTLLHEAAISNVGQSHYGVAEILLKNGADANAQDNKGQTPLYYLVENCTLEIVQLFLSYKADIFVLNKNKASILSSAVRNSKNPEVVQLLVDSGLCVNAISGSSVFDYKTILDHVVSANEDGSHYKIAEIILKNGANINCRMNDLVFYFLVANGNLEIVQLFLKYKLNIKQSAHLLERAAHNGKNPDVAQLLIDQGFDVHYQDIGGRTPLFSAAICNEIDSHYEVAEVLLKNGADVNAKNHFGFTPLYYLVNKGNSRIIELFLNHGADVHLKYESGQNLLFLFGDCLSNADVLQKMIDFGLDVNLRDEDNKTPLHCVLSNSMKSTINNKIIKCFLKNGAKIDVFNSDGETPLIEALRELRESDDKITKQEYFQFIKKRPLFDFLLEQTDFNLDIQRNRDIFSYLYYEDPDDYDPFNKYQPQRYFRRWVLEHLAKLKFLNVPINQKIFQSFRYDTDLEKYLAKCTQELEVMNNSKPQNSWITFFNLLVNDRKKLKNYAGNEDLIKDFKSNTWVTKFPIYGEAIKKNVEKGLKRRKLFDQSSVKLCNYLPIFNSNHLIVKDIFDCIMSKKDLLKFCE